MTTQKVITLGPAPACYSQRTVEFDDSVTGERCGVDIKYVYRNPEQHYALIEDLNKANEISEEQRQQMSIGQSYQKKIEADAEYLTKIIHSWGVEEEPSYENIRAFILRYPAASVAIGIDYHRAVHEGRSGN